MGYPMRLVLGEVLAEDFAERIARKLLSKLDDPWNLEVRDSLAAECDDLGLLALHSRNDDGLHDLVSALLLYAQDD